MSILQSHKCAICFNRSANKLVVDHCHKTQKVRGLLCDRCNLALGVFEKDGDAISIMISAMNYLKKNA